MVLRDRTTMESSFPSGKIHGFRICSSVVFGSRDGIERDVRDRFDEWAAGGFVKLKAIVFEQLDI